MGASRRVRLVHTTGRLINGALNRLTGRVTPNIGALRLSGVTRRFVESGNTIPTFLKCKNFPGSVYTSIGRRIMRNVPSSGAVLGRKSIVSISYNAILGNFINSSTCAFYINRISPGIGTLLGAAGRSLCLKVRRTVRNGHLKSVDRTVRFCYRSGNCSIIERLINRNVKQGVRRRPRIPGCKHPNYNPLLHDNVYVYVRPVVGVKDGGIIFRGSN